MDHYEVVTKLIGPIRAVGEHNEDCRRMTNLEDVLNLVDRLLFDIDEAARDRDRPEASMQAIGERAHKAKNYFMEILTQ